MTKVGSKVAVMILGAAWAGISFSSAAEQLRAQRPEASPDYLAIVRAYVDALLKDGRDRIGDDDSPLFATTLNRETLRPFEGDELARIVGLDREQWGIRSHDRMIFGANPMHDQNLYQILYALSRITGEARYGDEADRTLEWFLTHCQSDATGLLAWGEHIGWDFRTERPIEKQAGMTHEFFRPWTLWKQCFRLAPDACGRFARGLWDHQIADQETGDFSRHALYDRHAPGRNSQYPRHGGFYIGTWARAYERTRDPVYLEAIETVLGFFERHRSPSSGAIPAEVGNKRSHGRMLWPLSNLSLAVDLWDASQRVPEETAGRMRQCALKTDEVLLRIEHDLGADGAGFVVQANTHTLHPEDIRQQDVRLYSDRWATAYGQNTDAQMGNLCLLRYRQLRNDGYRRLILASADRYLDGEPEIAFPVYPGTLGDVMYLMLGAHELTGDRKYLDRADHFGRLALGMFFDEQSPLPKASSQHGHYEAVTRADTLMMALLKLWLAREKPELPVSLIWCDR